MGVEIFCLWLVDADVGDDFGADYYDGQKPKGGSVVFGAVSFVVRFCGILEYYDCRVKLKM